MSKQSANALSEEEYDALLEEQQRQHDEVSFYEQSKHEIAPRHAPLASNEPCKYSWADARAKMEEQDYESDSAEENDRKEHVRQAEELAACAQAEQEAEKYAVALAHARAKIENCALSRKAYGPFMEAMIIAHAKCDLKFPPSSKEWWNELEKYDVIHEYRGWCFSKMSGSISAGW